MTSIFNSLPIIDLTPLCSPSPSESETKFLSERLYEVFSTTGFAYFVNYPISFSHEDVFRISKEFFDMSKSDKMSVAKRSFNGANKNTYRGYFPTQPGSDNLKEGFEMGPPMPVPQAFVRNRSDVILTEPNLFPRERSFKSKDLLEKLYTELQALSMKLLSLLAISLGKSPSGFAYLMENSVSTLRLLHYPAIKPPTPKQELSCTPHTDSGLLTLLHQDSTGGLEVRNAAGDWISAPYVAGSIVANIGDLMAQMSDGKFVATYHRVKSSEASRFSVPFFFEPGVDAMVGKVGKEIHYGSYVLGKMATWIEFQEVKENPDVMGNGTLPAVDVGA